MRGARAALWRGLLAVFLALAAAAAPAPRFSEGLYRGQVVQFAVWEGWAVAEGDIILGPAALLEEALREREAAHAKPLPPAASAVVGDFRLWPGGLIPYVIDSDIPNQTRITGAIAHLNQVSPLQLVARGNEPNYVRFRRVQANGVCSSSVGMVGGAQSINVDDLCSQGTIIHEIGHAAGLWHEQSRNDRDAWIRVRYENIEAGYRGQFDQRLSGGRDIGPYDYASIMHYGSGAFSNGLGPSIESLPYGIPFGFRTQLSAGDVFALRQLYGQAQGVVISTNPEGLEVQVDGVSHETPVSFAWAPGSEHEISAPLLVSEARSRLRFARWSDFGARTHRIRVGSAPAAYLASYTRENPLTVSVQPTEGGAVFLDPPSPDGYYGQGAPVRLTARPAQGWHFAGWSYPAGRELSALGANPATVTAGNYQITATFRQTPPTVITSDPPGLRVDVDGVSRLTPFVAMWEPGSLHTVAARETLAPAGAPRTRHVFRGWSDNGAREHSITAGAVQTLVASYRTEYKPEFTISPRNAGTLAVHPPSPDGYYEAGATLELIATAADPYRFFNWSGGAVGDNPGRLTVSGEHSVTVNFSLPGTLLSSNIVHGALMQRGPLSPGGLVSLFGLDIGPAETRGAVVAGGRVQSQILDTRVLFGGVAAPLLYVSPKQINAVAPYALTGQVSTNVTVESRGRTLGPVAVDVWPARPGIFTGEEGRAVAWHEDHSWNSPANPAPRGSVVVFWATGLGLIAPLPPDGELAAAPLARPELPINVLVEGRDAVIEYAGAAPGLVAGVMQVNVRIPDGVRAGPDIPLLLRAGDYACAAPISLR